MRFDLGLEGFHIYIIEWPLFLDGHVDEISFREDVFQRHRLSNLIELSANLQISSCEIPYVNWYQTAGKTCHHIS